MQDFFQRLNALFLWSVPLFTVKGIRVRVHSTLIILTAALFLWSFGPFIKDAPEVGGVLLKVIGLWFVMNLILWTSILLHEFGHCYAAFRMGGGADQILMWPLGGLAMCHVPNTPRANFVMTAGGPAVNVVLAALSIPILLAIGYDWGANWSWWLTPFYDEPFVAWVLKINLLLLFFNVIPAFPMDGGRMFQTALWPRLGYRRATFITVRLAQVLAVVFVVGGLFLGAWLLIGIGIFNFMHALQEWRLVESGARQDDRVFGYDFSQGYTSLGEPQGGGGSSRPGPIARWRERRRRRRERREREAGIERRRRVDELLEKIHTEGIHSLTPKERAFLEDASKDYRR